MAGSSEHAAVPTAGQMEDELLAGLAAGDPAALTRLAECWGPRIYRYFARRLVDPELVRDLTQETLIRAVGPARHASGQPGGLDFSHRHQSAPG